MTKYIVTITISYTDAQFVFADSKKAIDFMLTAKETYSEDNRKSLDEITLTIRTEKEDEDAQED